jgi:hypothetical protein
MTSSADMGFLLSIAIHNSVIYPNTACSQVH